MNKERIIATLESIKRSQNLGITEYNAVCDIIAEAVTELQREVNKSRGCASLEKPFMSVLKDAVRASGYDLPLNRAVKHEGRTWVCDGYRILATAENIDLPENTGADADNYPKVWDIMSQTEAETAGTVQELPTAAEIKQGIKAATERAKLAGKKAKDIRPVYRFPDGYSVNARFLLDLVTATGAGTMRYAGAVKPAYAESEDGQTKGLLLPIRWTGPEVYGFTTL